MKNSHNSDQNIIALNCDTVQLYFIYSYAQIQTVYVRAETAMSGWSISITRLSMIIPVSLRWLHWFTKVAWNKQTDSAEASRLSAVC